MKNAAKGGWGRAVTAQREYNLCPGCGKTSTPYRGGYIHGGISWHDGCLGRKPITTKEGFADALRRCENKQDELDLMEAHERLSAHSDAS